MKATYSDFVRNEKENDQVKLYIGIFFFYYKNTLNCSQYRSCTCADQADPGRGGNCWACRSGRTQEEKIRKGGVAGQEAGPRAGPILNCRDSFPTIIKADLNSLGLLQNRLGRNLYKGLHGKSPKFIFYNLSLFSHCKAFLNISATCFKHSLATVSK